MLETDSIRVLAIRSAGRIGLLLPLFAFACVAGDSGSPAIVQRDSAGIAIVENEIGNGSTATCTIDAEPTVTIGETGGAPEYELYRVFGAGRLGDGRIVLVNQGSQEIRFYDAHGVFLHRAGRAGEGPGEFRDAFQMWVLPGDTVWVGDYRPWQFQIFGPDGDWVRTVRPRPEYINPPAVMAVLHDGHSLLGDRTHPTGNGDFELLRVPVVLHGPDGTQVDTLGTYPHGRWGQVDDDPRSIITYPLFESFLSVGGSGNRIAIGHASEPSVSLHELQDGEVKLTRIVRWTTGDRAVSSHHIDAARRAAAERGEGLGPEERRLFVDPLVSPDRPVADRFPAFSALHVGRDGRLWVREYARPDAADAGRRWIVFDTDGALQCTALMPEIDRILELGTDYVLALQRDELDVERVVNLGVISPTGGQ